MRSLLMTRAMADQRIRCDFCPNVIEPAELFWRLSDGDGHDFGICTDHIPLNTKEMIVEPSSDGVPITSVRADAVNVRRDIIPKLLADWNAVYSLSPDEFEELVFDRLFAMDLEAFRMGPVNQRDGGIDIIFWTRGILPMLGAVQVKHHRSPETKTGPAEVRELGGAMQGHHFNIGLIITNTSFTEDAKHQIDKGSFPIQLRDGEALRKWVADDFEFERVNFETRTIEFTKGFPIQVPRFL